MNQRNGSQFGVILRQLREAAGFSQEELAYLSGVSVRGISDLERGVRMKPRVETIRLVADALQLSEEDRQRLRQAGKNRIDIHTLQIDLPIPSTSFIGRRVDVVGIEKVLINTRSRLVTLIGPGGVGKTRIAIEVARNLSSRDGHSTVFVDLTPVRNPELVLTAIALAVGVPGESGEDVKERLMVAMQHRKMLLILDNLEQVVAAATDISWLLSSCPSLQILATSRVPLRIGAEHIVPIESMDIPSSTEIEDLLATDAASLFVERATAANAMFSLTPENTGDVRAIVERLQGMPLAIELAAARIRALPLVVLRDLLEHQLSVLVGGYRDAPQRHRTMRETIVWSYDLLNERDRQVFRALSIFPVGCTLATATDVVQKSQGYAKSDVLESIDDLVESSLLRPYECDDGEARYRMLQTVREYGLEQLAAHDADDRIRHAAHERWCLPLATRAEFVAIDPDAAFWLRRLEAENQNLIEHLAWLIGNGLVTEALDVSGSLAPFRCIRSYLNEGRHELEGLLNDPRSRQPDSIRAKALIGLGQIYFQQDEIASSLSVLERGADLARECDSHRQLVTALIIQALALIAVGRHDEAEAHLNAAHEIAEAINDADSLAGLLLDRALVCEAKHEWDEAYRRFLNGMEYAMAINNPWFIALSKMSLGYHLMLRRRLEDANAFMRDAERLFLEIGDRRFLPRVQLQMADIACARGDLGNMKSHASHALHLWQEAGSWRGIAQGYASLAQHGRLTNNLDKAIFLLNLSMSWWRRGGALPQAIQCLDEFAEIALLSSQPERTAWCIGAVEGTLDRHQIRRRPNNLIEHNRRLDDLKARLDESIWQAHYLRGQGMTDEAILAEVDSWRVASATAAPENVLIISPTLP